MENLGWLLGANGPLRAHFIAKYCSHPLWRSRSGLAQEAPLGFRHDSGSFVIDDIIMIPILDFSKSWAKSFRLFPRSVS